MLLYAICWLIGNLSTKFISFQGWLLCCTCSMAVYGYAYRVGRKQIACLLAGFCMVPVLQTNSHSQDFQLWTQQTAIVQIMKPWRAFKEGRWLAQIRAEKNAVILLRQVSTQLPLQTGEQWQLRLQWQATLNDDSAHFISPALHRASVSAIAKVIPNKDNHRLQRAPWWQRLRQYYAEQLMRDVEQPALGLLQALYLGMKEKVSQQINADFSATGTRHLLAISGLHMGLVISISLFITMRLCRCVPYSWHLLTANQIAIIFSLIVAVFYSALAGFSLPTVRAVMMSACVMLSTLLGKQISFWHGVSIALLSCLLRDPFVTDQISFILSFSAVAWLLYLGRQHHANETIWRQLIRMQIGLTIAMCPLNIGLFHRQPVYSLLANMIAIPCIGWLILPLGLLAMLVNLIYQPWASILWQAAACVMQGVVTILHAISAWPSAVWHQQMSGFAVVLASFGVMCFSIPGFPAKLLTLSMIVLLMTGR